MTDKELDKLKSKINFLINYYKQKLNVEKVDYQNKERIINDNIKECDKDILIFKKLPEYHLVPSKLFTVFLISAIVAILSYVIGGVLQNITHGLIINIMHVGQGLGIAGTFLSYVSQLIINKNLSFCKEVYSEHHTKIKANLIKTRDNELVNLSNLKKRSQEAIKNLEEKIKEYETLLLVIESMDQASINKVLNEIEQIKEENCKILKKS